MTIDANGATREADRDLIDLSAVVHVIGIMRWWLFGSVVFFSVIFISAAFTMEPVYRSATVLIPTATERGQGSLGGALGQLGGIAALAGISVGGGDAETEEALAVLRSRQFTQAFILKHELMPKLFADKWDATRNRWSRESSDPPTLAEAYRRFKETRRISQDKKTGLITLQIEWTDREAAAEWANGLVEDLNEEMRHRAISRADAYVSFLENELKSRSTVEIREAVGRLVESQVKQRMLANVSQEYAFRAVDRALPADIDDPARPNKLLMFILGPVVGFAFGVIGILMHHSFSGKGR